MTNRLPDTRRLVGASFATVLAVLLASSLLFAGTTALAGGHATPVDFSVTKQTVDIDYGNKIRVTTVVDTGSESANSVRALFRPRGGSTIWSYSYPEFLINGNQATVTFEISTGPGSYYPPGTDFDIEIEVTWIDGTTELVRSEQPVEYLDPDVSWKRVTGDGYTVVYYGVSDSDVNNLVAQTNSRISTLKSVLGVTDTPDFKAVVFPSVKDATPSFPPVSQTATDQFLFAGFAQAQYRLFVQGQMNPTTFIHELAHLYTHEAVSSSLIGGLPAWLNEGLARFLETGSSASSASRLRSSVRPDELLSLRNMITIPGQRSDVFIFYPQAGAFVGYLVEEFGSETIAEYLKVIDEGATLLEGFEQVYGQSLYNVENTWRAKFDANPLVIPTPTQPPVQPSEGSAVSTTVPLVDFSAGGAGRPDSGTANSNPDVIEKTMDTGTVAPAFLPTVTPETPSELAAGNPSDGSDPDYVVAGIVVGLSVLIGLWLFVSRRSKKTNPQA